jgi:uncharacterized protein YbjT (DUF2867 family)
MENYRAVVVGGTGAVGASLVRELLSSQLCEGVVALVRRPVDQFDTVKGREKLALEEVDLSELETATTELASGCDLAFKTMGIGQPRKVSREVFRRVDLEYAAAFAKGSAAAGIRHISMLSSVGANLDSRSFYLRIKGEAEKAVVDAGMTRTSLFQPSLLVTEEIRYGLQDRVTQVVFPRLSPFLPGKYHEIHVEELGRAMRLNAEQEGTGTEVLRYPEFRAILDGGS